MKTMICSITGAIGSAIAYLFGGWDESIATLLLFMLIDYISGLIVAGVFKKSPKTDTGALESRAGWKGLCKKCMTLFFVIIAYRLDLLNDTTYIRDWVCIAFITNEFISITENAGLIGLPIPKAFINAIDLLKKKGGSKNEQAN